jgi:hypothetical protein
MVFGLAILATALLLSAVAAYYSVAGLVAIFSAATIPVIIMGGSLELGKIAATVWLHNNWRRAGWAFKAYLIPAVAFLMLLTSMGIFGYLSKAHSDQSLVSGDVQAKIAIYDEKIKTERENIDANRRALKQLDEAVDQVMGRSTTEEGAARSVQIRRGQQAERGRLLREIEQSQKKITVLNEERAPIAAEVRKVEAEVGPIKYIAALVYGDNPDTNLLERAVRWMIIMIVLVFDPLALALILAANKQFEWVRQGRGGWDHDDPQYPRDDGPLTTDQIDQIKASTNTNAYLYKGNFWQKPEGWESVGPMVAPTPKSDLIESDSVDDEIKQEVNLNVRQAMKAWKQENPQSSLKEQRRKLSRGEIDELPWMSKVPLQDTFGPEFVDAQRRGDTHMLTKTIPHSLFKWNGKKWMAVDKIANAGYTANSAYISFLIGKIESGEYDPDLLTDAEREQVANQLTSGRT